MRMATGWLLWVLAGCGHGPYPAAVQEAFRTRCARELWPPQRPAGPGDVDAYCACLLHEQERHWRLGEYNEEWAKIDTGYYQTPRQVFGLFATGGGRYPDDLLEAMGKCLTRLDTRAAGG